MGVGPMGVGPMLQAWACAWEACTGDDLQHHVSMLHIKQLLATTASMLRIATVLGIWHQESRPSASSSAAVCLPEELSGVWSAASYLVALVVSSLEWRIANDANPHYWEPEPLLTALEHAIHALREASAAWQWCHSSSGSSSAAFQVHLDAREWLPELCCNLAMLATVLQEKLLEENEEQRQPAIWSRDSAAAVMNVLALALEVEVKAVQALEVGSWGKFGLDTMLQLSHCLDSTLSLASHALSGVPGEESTADGQCWHGGCPERLLPAAPYLHIIPAVQTLLRVGERLPDHIMSTISKQLVSVLCWLLKYKGNSALHAGVGRLLLACCTAPCSMAFALRELRAIGGDVAALGAIPLLGAVAESLIARRQEPRDVPMERQLSMDAAKLLRRCCTTVDAAAGTSFAAMDAEIEAEGAQIMRDLISTGQSEAADIVRQGIWVRRSMSLLPRLTSVLQRGLQVMACAGQAHGCGSISSSSCDGNQVPLCPWVAVACELEKAVGRACNNPTCCVVLVAGGSKLLVCRGCQVARYCSISCAQADWRRHRPVCRAIRGLERRDVSERKYVVAQS